MTTPTETQFNQRLMMFGTRSRAILGERAFKKLLSLKVGDLKDVSIFLTEIIKEIQNEATQ